MTRVGLYAQLLVVRWATAEKTGLRWPLQRTDGRIANPSNHLRDGSTGRGSNSPEYGERHQGESSLAMMIWAEIIFAQLACMLFPWPQPNCPHAGRGATVAAIAAIADAARFSLQWPSVGSAASNSHITRPLPVPAPASVPGQGRTETHGRTQQLARGTRAHTHH